jgi:hypothetical protein
MTTAHRLTGYDKETERLVFEFDIPPSQLERAKELANVGRDDPDAVGSYPLDSSQAGRVAGLVNQVVDVDRYSWFLEPFADDGAIEAPAA